MKVHLVDGTYELFRQHFGAGRLPQRDFAATIGLMTSTLSLISEGATHVGVATDHQIRSFRNELWPGYKTGEDTPEDLATQIPMAREALMAIGVAVWPMVEFEADDALASAARVASEDARVHTAYLVTPDKDLAQCVEGTRVVQVDRRSGAITDAAGVVAKFGVLPSSIPDYLALVGDSSDGFPGLPGWGAKSAAAVLDRYRHLEAIPDTVTQWDVPGLRGAARLADTLAAQRDLALLFRRIATVVRTVDVGSVDDWAWRGPSPELAELAADLGAPTLATRAARLWERHRSTAG